MAVPCGAVPASAASTITGPAGLGLIAAWIHRDNEEFDGLLGNDEGAEEILPVAIGEQITALERLAGPDEAAPRRRARPTRQAMNGAHRRWRSQVADPVAGPPAWF